MSQVPAFTPSQDVAACRRKFETNRSMGKEVMSMSANDNTV